MEKKNIYALIAVLLLGGLAIVAMRAPEKGDRVGEKPRPVAEIKSGAIATVEVMQPGGKDAVKITKQGERWQVVSPYDKPADQSVVKSAVESLEKAKWGDITTQQKDRHAELEVSDDKAIHVVAKDASGTVLADLYLGKASGSNTMVRIAGKDDVWQAEISANLWKRDAKLWRDHAIFDMKADDAQKVVLAGGGSKATLERLPAAGGDKDKDKAPASIFEAKWKLVLGEVKTLRPGVELDHGLLNRLVSGVASLRASEFVDGAKPEETGLADGAPNLIEVQVSFKDGKSAGLRIGNAKGEDYYAQALNSPQVFFIKKWTVEQLAHLPADLGDKTVVSLKADQIDQISIVQGADTVLIKAADKSWKADKLADADEAKLKAVAEGFDGVQGSTFAAPTAPELASLVKPRATITVKPKTGAPVVIKVGDAKGEEALVQVVGGEPMWLKKFSLDRILKKPSELAKDKK